MNEITKVIFEAGKNKAEASEPIWQWSYGQILHIEGLTLPHEVEIQFSLQKIGGIAERQIGITKDGITEVSIPNKMLENRTCQSDEYTIYAWIYLSDERSGQTEYEITIPCKVRSRPGDYAPKNEPNFAGKVIDELNKLGSEKLTKPPTAKVGQIFRVQEVNGDGTLTLEAVDMPSGGAVDDVQIDGTSIVGENGVAEIPVAERGRAGVMAVNPNNMKILYIDGIPTLYLEDTDKISIDRRYGSGRHISPSILDYSVESAMGAPIGEGMIDGVFHYPAWTSDEQAAARARMGVERGTYATGKIVLDEETKIVNVDLSSSLSEKDEITDVYVLIESDQVVSAGSGNITSDTTNGIIGFFDSMSFSESQKRFVRMHTFVESDICVCECSSGNGNETSGNYLVWQYYKNSMENSGSLKKARKFALSINATMSQGDTAEFYFVYRKGTYA